MNHVHRDCIGKFVVVYFDEILIYSRCLSDHLGHLRQVFHILRKNQLFGNLEKCTFCVDSVIFLGFIINKKRGSCGPRENQGHPRVAYP
uniref:Retrotransposon-like protein 1 n=1 Tax=Cajanus cajan TaxID=3821 RepID=A0A151SAC1_CAJCA|nr:Retrotransposon-like protein 1 [Cajanus cajan]